MSARWWRDAILLAGLLIAAWLWWLGWTSVPLVYPAPTRIHIEPIGEIRGAQIVRQSLVAPYDGLRRIDVWLADFGQPRTGPVFFRLVAGDTGAVIFERQFGAEEIKGDVVYVFDFPAVPDSAGKPYYFELAAPQATPGNSITAYVQPSDGYPDGQASFAGQSVPGDVVFSMSFSVGRLERARILLQQAAAGKPGAWGQAGFYIILGALYAVLIAALFAGLRRASW